MSAGAEDMLIALCGTLGAVILVGSGLRARRLSARTWLGHGLIWAGIILSLWAAIEIARQLAK